MTLHILSNPEKAQLCQQSLTQDDSVILIGDGAYSANEWPKSSTAQLNILHEDAATRGLDINQDLNQIQYDEFVALSTIHKNSISWF